MATNNKLTACLIALAAMLALTIARPASAANLGIDAFVGAYQGSGVADGRDKFYFTITARDLDVTIRAADKGFQITWTSITHNGGAANRVTRKSETLNFTPVSEKGPVFRAVASSDPLTGRPYYWARIAGQTLTVYALAITPAGGYELSTWARTVTPSGMELVYRRVGDGEPQRTVKGTLAKVAK